MHVQIARNQKVLRRGPHNYFFAGHFYHGYVDCKSNTQNHGWTRVELWNDCVGTELYLMYLQSAGFINI